MRLVRRGLSVATAIAALAITGASPSPAQGTICLDLQSRLFAIESGMTGEDPNARQHDAQISKQRAELDRAMAQARRAGCIGLVIFRRAPEAQCGRLMARVNRIEANLTRLASARDRTMPGAFSLANQRNEIMQALATNRCREGFAGVSPHRPGLFATLFGGGLRTWGEEGFFGGSPFGTYRTLCVRTCDGYYFPISFSTVPAKFGADEQVCQASCPGAEVALFTHRNPGEDAEQMVSLAGQPYATLPTAFLYRTKYDSACACRTKTAVASAITATAGIESAAESGALVARFHPTPSPSSRPVAGEDPETLANRAGAFQPGQAMPRDKRIAGQTDEKAVRIVGPSFYFSQ